jgi:hypothetical protein
MLPLILIFLFIILQIIYGVIIINYYNNCEDESKKHIYTLGQILIFSSLLLLLANFLLYQNYNKSMPNIGSFINNNMNLMMLIFIIIIIISIISGITSFYIFMDIKRENSVLYNYTIFITPYTIYNFVVCSIFIMLATYLNLCYFTKTILTNTIKQNLLYNISPVK